MRVYYFLRDLFIRTSNIRKQINQDFERLSIVFNEELDDFEQFKNKEKLKVKYFSEAINVWDKHWKKSEHFFQNMMPALIKNQLKFLKMEFKLINDSDYLIKHIIKDKEREQSIIIRKHIEQVWSEFREDLKDFLGKESELKRIFHQYGTQIRLRLRKIEDILENQLKIFSDQSSVELFQKSEQLIKQFQEELVFIEETDLFIINNLKSLKVEAEKWISNFENDIPNLEAELSKFPRYYRSENIGARYKIGDIVDFNARQHHINSVDKDAVFLSEKPSGYYIPWHGGDVATTYEIYGNLKILSKVFDNHILKCYEYQAKPFKVIVVSKGISITLDKMGAPVQSILYKCRVIEE